MGATYAFGAVEAGCAKKAYNLVWGESGLDPNDNNGVTMNGYHAFSTANLTHKELKI